VRFMRGRILGELGRFDDALEAYRDVLSRAPDHVDARNALGVAEHAAGRRSAARAAFEAAVRSHPDHPAGHVNLAHVLVLEDVAAARRHYETALRLDPACTAAHQGMVGLHAMLGDRAAAARHRRLGFARPIERVPYYGEGTPIPALWLVSTDGGNVGADVVLDPRVFLTYKVFVEACEPSTPLPWHRVTFCGIGDADRAGDALAAAAAILARTTRPVINHPARLRASERVANAERLAALRDVIAPRARRLARAALAGADIRFPLVLRAPGHHMGRYSLLVERPDELAAAAARLPGGELIASEFVDVRGGDGWVRKYRAMIAGGRIYPLHLAISQHWKVHYFSAPMAEHPEHRAEEARFLADLPAALGPRATAALERIRDALALDYAGIDFALGAGGDVVVFEANAAMSVLAPDADPRWDYRRAPVARIVDALRALATERAAIE
jgi:glutathione synthase/RimK-type ligase-like ATP-grasp enzyme